MATNRQIEPLGEPSVTDPHGLNGHAADFERFYETYPLHKGRGAAIRAFKTAIKKAPIDVLVAGAERYRDDPQRKPEFTKHPATWLNGQCWADEELPGAAQPYAQYGGDTPFAKAHREWRDNGRKGPEPRP